MTRLFLLYEGGSAIFDWFFQALLPTSSTFFPLLCFLVLTFYGVKLTAFSSSPGKEKGLLDFLVFEKGMAYPVLSSSFSKTENLSFPCIKLPNKPYSFLADSLPLPFLLIPIHSSKISKDSHCFYLCTCSNPCFSSLDKSTTTSVLLSYSRCDRSPFL